jgi:hypothetical protein
MNEMNEVRYYKPINFKIEELISKTMFNRYGEKCWMFFDSRLLWTIDKIREKYGSVIINNWLWGGTFEQRGFRESNAIGAQNSQHKFGRAVDFHLKSMNCKEMRDLIKAKPNNEEFQYITAIEDFENMNWVHIDVRNWNKKENGLLIFNK